MPYIKTKLFDPDYKTTSQACVYGLMRIDGIQDENTALPAKCEHHLQGLFETQADHWYEEWKKEVMSYFPVKYEHPWVYPECNYKTLHLMIILLRQPIEDGSMNGLSKALQIPRKGDPLQDLLDKTGEEYFYHEYGHGLWQMKVSMNDSNIPSSKISLKKAIEDLSKDTSGFMINDLWRKDVRIGYVP